MEKLTLTGPADVPLAVPYLLGFHPERSLVVIGIGGPHASCVLRYDLPAPESASIGRLADHCGHVLVERGLAHAVVVGYGPEPDVRATILPVTTALKAAGIQLVETLRVHADRWWSYTGDPSGCPDGTPIRPAESVIPAKAMFMGCVAFNSRDDLADTLAPMPERDRAPMIGATAMAERRWEAWADEGRAALCAHVCGEGVSWVRSVAEQIADGAVHLSDQDAAWLVVLLRNLRLRDELWIRIESDHLDEHVAFWTDLVRRVNPDDAAAPAALLAWAAFQQGHGALANMALDRAFAADPGYSMASLVACALENAVPPASAALGITPEELAALYEAQGEIV